MRFRTLTLVALMLLHTGARAQLRSCPEIDMPADSLILQAMGSQLAVHPKTFPRDYTGCAYAWLEVKPKLYSIAWFREGKLVEGMLDDGVLPRVFCNVGQDTGHKAYCRTFEQFWTDSFREQREQGKQGFGATKAP